MYAETFLLNRIYTIVARGLALPLGHSHWNVPSRVVSGGQDQT